MQFSGGMVVEMGQDIEISEAILCMLMVDILANLMMNVALQLGRGDQQ
jgi:hypothetical protein